MCAPFPSLPFTGLDSIAIHAFRPRPHAIMLDCLVTVEMPIAVDRAFSVFEEYAWWLIHLIFMPRIASQS